MAYETGSCTSYLDFVTKLRSFLTAQGWTVTDAGNDDWGGDASIFSKGLCHLYFGPYDYNETNYYQNGPKETKTIQHWRMGLGTSAPADPMLVMSPYDMPGAPTYNAVNELAVRVDMTLSQGSYSAYHFFAESNYVNIVLEMFGDSYWQIGFGELDTGSLTHSGAAYVTASRNRDYNDSSGTEGSANNPSHESKFGTGRWGRDSRSGGGQMQVRLIDALRSGVGYDDGDVIHDHDSIVSTFHAREMGAAVDNGYYNNSTYIALLDVFKWSGPLPVGGATPMGAMPVFIRSSADRITYVGDVPAARLIKIGHLSPGDEIALASDTWKVFPMYRKTATSEIETSRARTSGHQGYAFKKVV